MTKMEAIAQIEATLPALTTEQAQALAALAEAWTRPTPPEDEATRAAIAEGLAQADRGEFVSEADVAAAFARFRSR
jgi:predicted transcriptional regulator